MQRDKMKKSLERLGVPVDDYRVLKLLPLIYVAWADGKMERVKRDRIHYFASREYELSAAGVAVLEPKPSLAVPRWRSTGPTPCPPRPIKRSRRLPASSASTTAKAGASC